MKRIYLLIAFILSNLFSYGQWKETLPSMPSPNAAALGNYGEIPVSYFTGVPNISIPLYTVKCAEFELPISLSYHPAIRPDYHPGWTGVGWNLFCGGAITRKQNGMVDERWNVIFGKMGYYFNHGALNSNDWANNLSNQNAYPIGSLDQKDVAPDEFSFNFLGYSGKFFLDHTGEWRVQSQQPLKVVFNPSDFIYPFITGAAYGTGIFGNSREISKTFKQFTIIDGNGTKYTFGGSENAIEYSDDIAYEPQGMAYSFIATSWNLTKIESADGSEVINLNYIRGPFTSYLFKDYSAVSIYSVGSGSLSPDCWIGGSSNLVDTNGRTISPVYLSSIEIPRYSLLINFSASKCNDLQYQDTDYKRLQTVKLGWGSIDDYHLLEYTTNIHFDNPLDATGYLYKRFIWRKLDAISIINTATNQQLKKIVFSYREQSTKRLRLKSVAIKDNLNRTVQPYSFVYEDFYSLPNYLTKMGDHWGFNNNFDLPSSYNVPDFYTAKEPDEAYGKAEVLKEIFYPTGGSTAFQFESHKYSSIVTQDRSGLLNEPGTSGGLRIRKVVSKDGTGAPIEKEYFYVNGYQQNADVNLLSSSGVLDSKPQYRFLSENAVDTGGKPFSIGIYASNPVIPLSPNGTGTHIAYSEVVEKNTDDSYSIFKFTNHDNGYKDTPPVATFNRQNVSYFPFSSRDFERGRLLNRSDYKNTGKLVREEINTYTRINESQKEAKSIEQNIFNVCNPLNTQRAAISRSAYLLYYYPFALTEQTIKKYTSDDNSTAFNVIEKTFLMDENKNMIEETVKNSKGELIRTNYKYPYNFFGNAVLDAMVNRHMIGTVIEANQWNATAGREMSKTITDYSFWPGTGFIKPSAVRKSFLGNAPEAEIICNSYDDKGNLIQYTTRDGVKTSFQFGLNKTFPIAKVTNAAVGEFFYEGFEETTGANIISGNAHTGSKYHTTNYTVPFLLPLGRIYTITWWVFSNNKWSLNTQAYTTNLVLTGTIDDVRVFPSENSLMTTCTYISGIGMTSITDPNNATTFYGYDNLNRLKSIKDNDRYMVKSLDYNYKIR
jgi:YD repeat-containing protein